MGKRSKELGRLRGQRAALRASADSVHAQKDKIGAGKVMTLEGEDKPLDPDSTIDLAIAGKGFPEGEARFATRDADPMRAFSPKNSASEIPSSIDIANKQYGKPPVLTMTAPFKRPFSPGGSLPMGTAATALQTGLKISIDINDDLKARIDGLRRPGEDDNAVIKRLVDPMRKFPHGTSERAAADELSKVMEGLSIEQRQTLLDNLGRKFDLPAAQQQGYWKGFKDKVDSEIKTSDPAKVRLALKALLDEPSINFTPEERRQLEDAMHIGGVEVALKAVDNVMEPIIKTRTDASAAIRRKIDAIKELREVISAPRLERLGESGLHKLLDAWKDGDVMLPVPGDDLEPVWIKETLDGHTIFVVQHDWALAFEKAEDFLGGEYRVPFDKALFEFRICGHRICFFVKADDGQPYSVMIVAQTSQGWMVMQLYESRDGDWQAFWPDATCDILFRFCANQVRAVAISLEAEVAVTELVRAPHKLNQARERKGKPPLFDHHLVNLARRRQYAPLPEGMGGMETEHHHKRLHWVRGHWRHFAGGHKTWIKWHLRGDWDLGFVEKEYRL